MELTISDIRIILDALEFKFAHFQKEQSKLDDSQEDRIAELSNDIYYLELLIDCFKDEYRQRIEQIKHEHQESVLEFPKTKIAVGIREDPELYMNEDD